MNRGNPLVRLSMAVMGIAMAAFGLPMLIKAAGKVASLTDILALPKDDLASAGKGLLLTLSGGFFLITAIRLTIASRKQKQLYDELLALNSRVTGTVTEVRTDYSVRINHRYARIAMVRCPFPRGEVILKSHRLWNIVPAVGDTVDVLFDPMDESRYVVDFMDK